jgi:hypothetical protein
MINITKLTEEDKNRQVKYTPFEGCDNDLLEYGHITSWNDTYVFVDYGNSCGRGIATEPRDLDFIFGN